MNIEDKNYFCEKVNERFLNTRWKELEFEKEILSFIQAFVNEYLDNTYEISYEVEDYIYVVSVKNTNDEVLLKVILESFEYEFKYMIIENVKFIFFNN